MNARAAATAATPATEDAAARRAEPPEPPAVSVLIPAWNAEWTIERAVRSVLAERAVSIECVVVDDGSTDGTPPLLARLAGADPRMVVVRSEVNEGVSGALNRGLDVARGEWLTFLGADDRLFPGALARMLALARREDARVVVGQRVWSNGRRTWISRFYDIPDIRRPGRKSLADAPGLVYYASGTGKLFHRSVAAGLRFYGRVLGDQPWAIRALLRAGDRIWVIPDTVYEWTRVPPRREAGSITNWTRSSAERGGEAAEVAERAFHDVREEAQRLLAPDGARRVTARYAERLLRSDLGMHLLYALRRGDPTTVALFAAIERFVRSVPPEDLAASDALAREVVERPLRRWSGVPPDARAAYWSLLAAAFEADPGLATRERDPLARLALRTLGRGPDGPRRAAATALLRVAWVLAFLGRGLRTTGRRLTARTGMPGEAAP